MKSGYPEAGDGLHYVCCQMLVKRGESGVLSLYEDIQDNLILKSFKQCVVSFT